MTREEAIKWIDDRMCWGRGTFTANHPPNIDECWEAGRMAIESLHREEAEEKGYCHRIRPKNVEVVVRCKDCKWKTMYYKDNESFYCDRTGIINMHIEDGDDEFWCKYGERKEP